MNNPITFETHYAASPEKVWKAITDKEQMKQWYFDIPDFELKENATFNFYEPGNEKKFHHLCVIKEIVPNHKFQHTWTYPELSKGSSLLTWELIPDGKGTLVKLTHTGIESFADGGKDFSQENYEAGWNEILGKMLREFLEK
ncbi:MAG TPA: SRPBCC domain-containing protein [Bacteroidales bacterium]|nr:SRPBCC domain-containing protein [Bacteroidales bacterium]